MPAPEHKKIPAPRKSLLAALKANRRKLLIFAALALFGLISKLARIDHPGEIYFDEAYHAYTAELYVHGGQQAHDGYNPWVKNPPERASEWTHPPMAKLLMAVGIEIFGDRPLGWRIGSVVFGTLASLGAAELAFTLFSSVDIAILTLFFLTFETLFFAQSRIGMNDAYVVCFMTWAVVFYVRWCQDFRRLAPLYATGVLLGLALGTKWTTLYLIALLGGDLLLGLMLDGVFPAVGLWPHVLIAFGALPPLLYVASYGHYFMCKWGWSDFVELQRQMWYYHTGLSEGHSYSSRPWQWLLDARPVWMHVDYSVPGKVAHVYNFGNPVVLWTGLVAVLATLFKPMKRLTKRDVWPRRFILLNYFALWAPWIFSPRIMLFYHYMPALPALCVILARWVQQLRESGRAKRRMAHAILLATVLAAVVIYPIVADVRIPESIGSRVYHVFE